MHFWLISIQNLEAVCVNVNDYKKQSCVFFHAEVNEQNLYVIPGNISQKKNSPMLDLGLSDMLSFSTTV